MPTHEPLTCTFVGALYESSLAPSRSGERSDHHARLHSATDGGAAPAASSGAARLGLPPSLAPLGRLRTIIPPESRGDAGKHTGSRSLVAPVGDVTRRAPVAVHLSEKVSRDGAEP